MNFESAAAWIERLQLNRHIEGGWYKEVYKSTATIKDFDNHGFERSICTHIYFLLEKDDFSSLHRIRADESWHFYAGTPLTIYEFEHTGNLIRHQLGNDPSKGCMPYCVIQNGNWFGARIESEGAFSLVGCTVSPGFEFADLELAKAEDLSHRYPKHAKLIRDLCRNRL